MKKITYPSDIKIRFDKEMGKKLDFIAEYEHCSRPSAILKAIDFLFEHKSLVREDERLKSA